MRHWPLDSRNLRVVTVSLSKLADISSCIHGSSFVSRRCCCIFSGPLQTTRKDFPLNLLNWIALRVTDAEVISVAQNRGGGGSLLPLPLDPKVFKSLLRRETMKGRGSVRTHATN